MEEGRGKSTWSVKYKTNCGLTVFFCLCVRVHACACMSVEEAWVCVRVNV